jgi:hypothetical protein
MPAIEQTYMVPGCEERPRPSPIGWPPAWAVRRCAHAPVILDQAGWHTTRKLKIPTKLTVAAACVSEDRGESGSVLSAHPRTSWRNASPPAGSPDRPSLHLRERNSSMKNRKRESCTSGTVRDEDGNVLIYSARPSTAVQLPPAAGGRRPKAAKERTRGFGFEAAPGNRRGPALVDASGLGLRDALKLALPT